MIARDIMTKNVITVKKNATIEEIAKILTDNNIGGVPVVDDNNSLLGIITSKDLLYKDIEPRIPSYIEVLGGVFFVEGIKHYEEELRKLLASQAEEIMTKKVITITEDTEVKDIAELIVEKGVNRLPVLKDDKLVGIISRGDVVKSLIKK